MRGELRFAARMGNALSITIVVLYRGHPGGTSLSRKPVSKGWLALPSGSLFDKLILKEGKRRRRSPGEISRSKEREVEQDSGELCVSAITMTLRPGATRVEGVLL